VGPLIVLLLDTCTFIWLASEPDRLSKAARAALDRAKDIVLSDVSVWEICLKWQAGKIALPAPPRSWVGEQVREWRLERLAVELEHLYRSVEIPALHRDPFDRLLVAQTIVHDAKIVTPDPAIHQYPVATVW
jgi:PIN domain nuclease of toxin-antitoxin system